MFSHNTQTKNLFKKVTSYLNLELPTIEMNMRNNRILLFRRRVIANTRQQTYMRNDPLQFCRFSILFLFNIIFLIDANNCLQDVVFFCSFFSAKTNINFFIYIYKALNWWFWFFSWKLWSIFVIALKSYKYAQN